MRRVYAAFLVLVISWLIRLPWLRPMNPGDVFRPPQKDAVAPANTPTSLSGEIPASFIDAPLAFLSRAPVDSLTLLPGIGPVIAARIASARSGKRLFTRWDDVLAVRGIGPKTVERLKTISESQ